MSFSVSLDTSKLDSIIARIPGYRDQVVTATAAHILGNARKRAPVSKSPKQGRGHMRDNSLVVKGAGYTNVEFYAEYAPYVELGTWKMAAQPFLTPAVEEEAKLLEDRLRKGFPK